MTLNSLQFAFFFTIFLAVLLILPKKLRKAWLLLGNTVFYCSSDLRSGVLLLLTAVLTWFCGLKLEKDRKKRIFLIIPVLWTLGTLFFFKFTAPSEKLLRGIGAARLISFRDLIVPLGISFYTLRCISYTAEIARGTIPAERNPFDVLIYVSFFPQIISGPIERPGRFFRDLDRFGKSSLYDPERLRRGFLLVVWGLFQKLVLAERLAVISASIFSRFELCGFWELLAASASYTLQIYCDFSGYSDMSRGVSAMTGFSSVRNFARPYLAADIKSFWRRWHITLTSWLTDYIYIPLGGSRKGLIRKYLNIITVFLVSGLWHGSTLNFVFWGLLHAFFQIIQDLWQRTGKHLPRPAARILTLGAVNFAWIFFNSGGLNRGFRIVRQMFTHFGVSSMADIGIVPGDLFVLGAGLMILLIADLMHEKGHSIHEKAEALPLPLRWLLILGLLWSVIMLGIYGVGYDTGSFIYAQF